MNCEKFEEIIEDLLDGTADDSVHISAEAHVAACPACRELYSAHKNLSAELTQSGPVKCPADLRKNVMSRISSGDSPGSSARATASTGLRIAAAVPFAVALVIAYSVFNGYRHGNLQTKSVTNPTSIETPSVERKNTEQLVSDSHSERNNRGVLIEGSVDFQADGDTLKYKGGKGSVSFNNMGKSVKISIGSVLFEIRNGKAMIEPDGNNVQLTVKEGMAHIISSDPVRRLGPGESFTADLPAANKAVTLETDPE